MRAGVAERCEARDVPVRADDPGGEGEGMMMDIDPRHIPYNEASLRVRREMEDAAKYFELSDAEILSILNEIQASYIKPMLATEREKAERAAARKK